MMADTVQSSLQDVLDRARPKLGDFLVDVGHPGTEKLRLTECPICALDPARQSYRFDEEGGRRNPPAHFRSMHGPDDVGRPMAELLPPRGDGRGE